MAKKMKMQISLTRVAALVVPVVAFAILVTSTAQGAEEPFVYPTKGQSKEQTEKDKYSCYSWAKEQSGFDPMAAPTATAPPPKQRGGAVRGAAGGAALGAAVGAIAGDAGKGAAIGAASGGLIGGVRKRRSEAEQQGYAQEQTASYDKRRSDYNRAWGACLEGKGYTVK